MKIITSFLLLCLIACNDQKEKNSDKKSTTKKVNSQYVFTMDGMDELKIGMTQEEAEKLLGQKLTMKNAEANATSWVDTAVAKYKDLEVALYFQRQYTEENKFHMWLFGLSCKDARCSTDSGIKMGDDKETIIGTYPESVITMGPETLNDTTTAISKTKYSIYVKNDNWERQMIFNLENKKLNRVVSTVVFNDSE